MYAFMLILPLMLIIALGNVLKRKGFYSAGDISVLTRTLYWVLLPALFFTTAYSSGGELLRQLNLFIATAVCYVLTIAFAWLVSRFFIHKRSGSRVAVSVLSAIRSNNIYIGFPVVMLALGEAGLQQASIYIAVTSVSFQLLSIAAGELAMSRGLGLRNLGSLCLQVLKNPMVVTCLVGISMSVAEVPVPSVLKESMKLLSGAATAVALLALGGTIDLSGFGRVARIIRETAFDCFVRVVVCPALLWFCFLIWPVNRELAQVSILLTAMPAAVNVFILSREMHMDEEYGAKVVAATTVLSAVTIPAWGHLLGVV